MPGGGISDRSSRPISERSAQVNDRFWRRYGTQLDHQLGSDLESPIDGEPSWLPIVQERIFNSIASEEEQAINDGRWISSDVAIAAGSFFSIAANILPGEPHLSASEEGELIAQFLTKNGR